MAALPVAVWGQKVAFEVNAPRVVAVGEIFRIEYVTDSKPQDFKGPQFEGVDVLAGPTLSTSKSVSIVNGNMTQEVRYTYTYVLQCNSEGEFNVSEAVLTVKGKTYSAAPFAVRALTEQAAVSGEQGAGGHSDRPTLAPDDILIRAVVDRKEVYKGEPVRVTYKFVQAGPAESRKRQISHLQRFLGPAAQCGRLSASAGGVQRQNIRYACHPRRPAVSAAGRQSDR